MYLVESIRHEIHGELMIGRKAASIRVTPAAIPGSVMAWPVALGVSEIIVHPDDIAAFERECALPGKVVQILGLIVVRPPSPYI